MATGTGNLPHDGMDFTPFDILTAEEMDDLVENIESLADGTGIGDEAIGTSALGQSVVTAEKTAFGGDYSTSEVNTGFKWMGKDIFCRGFSGVITSAANNSNTVNLMSSSGIDQIIRYHGSLTNTSGTQYIMPTSWGTTRWSTVRISGGDIQLVTQLDVSRTNEPYALVIFYTKT